MPIRDDHLDQARGACSALVLAGVANDGFVERRSVAVRGAPVDEADRPRATTLERPADVWLAGAVVALAIGAHAVHDVVEGTRWQHTVLPSTILVLQMVALTGVHQWLRRRNGRRLPMLVVGALLSAVFGVLFLPAHTDLATNLRHAVLHGIPGGLAFGGFWALLVFIPAVVRDADLRSLAADAVRREAELAQLRSSLQPHFLLNTLSVVAALTVDQPLVARRLLAALGDLLRDALVPAPEIRPLDVDLRWLRRYAEILEVRHGEALTFEWDIGPDTTSVPLPKLLLQPLVENAVQHGALRRTEGGRVTLHTRLTDRGLRLVVEDNGPGIAPNPRDGLGLRIVRERLALAHPEATLRVESSSEGTCAVIDIPRIAATRS